MSKPKIAVIGLGYVGLPLAVAFDKAGYYVVGYDINNGRVAELDGDRIDSTGEISSDDLQKCNVNFTTEDIAMSNCNIYIVTVPTPVDNAKKPDLTPVIKASETVATLLSQNNIVIYESTVYPGATEEVCVPILQELSGLDFNKGFFVGYSPERINPGDPDRGVADIIKVVSGSTDRVAEIVEFLYSDIITAGVYRASSIKVAEAAKVIENTQRDVNIALINELAMLFDRLDIDTEEVLLAAGTKWNFLPFRPGLVGGHCIGVDPYYLTHKAQSVGHQPHVILAGRRVNDEMGAWIGSQIIKRMASRSRPIAGANVLVLGYTFKENCPDTRNTKVVDIINELNDYNVKCDVFDPYLDEATDLGVLVENIAELRFSNLGMYDAIVVAVAHDHFQEMGIEKIKTYGKENALVFDIKNLFSAEDTDWRL